MLRAESMSEIKDVYCSSIYYRSKANKQCLHKLLYFCHIFYWGIGFLKYFHRSYHVLKGKHWKFQIWIIPCTTYLLSFPLTFSAIAYFPAVLSKSLALALSGLSSSLLCLDLIRFNHSIYIVRNNKIFRSIWNFANSWVHFEIKLVNIYQLLR
jgi:hypothetical protein